MSNYRRQLEDAVEAIVIHSPTLFSWMGGLSPHLPVRVRRALTATTARAYLRFAVQNRLYHSFYRLGLTAPNDRKESKRTLDGRTPFVDALTAANRGQGFVEDGWVVRDIRDPIAMVEKHGLTVQVPVDECVVPAGDQIRVGESVGLPHPKELPAYSPGFYSAFGDRPFSFSNSLQAVRLYWNLTQEGAVPFVQMVSNLLNRARFPFRFKVLSDPDGYERCDAAVIYMPRDRYMDAIATIEQIYERIAPALRPATPVFTKPLAPGLGLAENPPGGHSFGMHRCGLVADGLITAHSLDRSRLRERVEVVINQLAEAGISIDMPFLNPGCTDSYGEFGGRDRDVVSAMRTAGLTRPMHRSSPNAVIGEEAGKKKVAPPPR